MQQGDGRRATRLPPSRHACGTWLAPCRRFSHQHTQAPRQPPPRAPSHQNLSTWSPKLAAGPLRVPHSSSAVTACTRSTAFTHRLRPSCRRAAEALPHVSLGAGTQPTWLPTGSPLHLVVCLAIAELGASPPFPPPRLLLHAWLCPLLPDPPEPPCLQLKRLEGDVGHAEGGGVHRQLVRQAVPVLGSHVVCRDHTRGPGQAGINVCCRPPSRPPGLASTRPVMALCKDGLQGGAQAGAASCPARRLTSLPRKAALRLLQRDAQLGKQQVQHLAPLLCKSGNGVQRGQHSGAGGVKGGSPRPTWTEFCPPASHRQQGPLLPGCRQLAPQGQQVAGQPV